MAKYSTFHIVYSPQDKSIINDKWNLFEKNMGGFKDWVISEEFGENNNRHLDIVYIRKGEVRTDNESRMWKLFVEPENKYEFKIYGIDRDIEWQVGYNRKEGGVFTCHDNSKWDFDKCVEIYKKNPERYKDEKKESKNWNVNTLGLNYIKFLDECKCFHDRERLKKFMTLNKEKIQPSMIQRFNYKRFEDWLDIQEKHPQTVWMDERVNVLGMVDDKIRILVETEKKENSTGSYIVR